MGQDKGASPEGDRAVHVIVRRVGCYEYTETLIAAFSEQAAAAAFVALASSEYTAAAEAVPDRLDYPEDGASDDEWAKWARRRKRAWSKFRKMLTCDPAAAPENEWSSPDYPDYYSVEVPFRVASPTPNAGDAR